MRWIAVVVLAVVPTLTASTTAAPAPDSDSFSAATPIVGAQGRAETSNAGATKEPGEPAHAGNSGGASVWFRWTAPRDGRFGFHTAGSEFDTLLAVYRGPALEALDQLAADDDSGPGGRSELSFAAVAGTVYHVAVDGFQGKIGRVRLAWRPAPPNDNFEDAQIIEGRGGRAATPSAGATKQPGEPRHAPGFEADQSVWFAWTAPEDMRVGFMASAAVDAIAVYAGASLATLVPVGDESSGIVRATAGTTYRIAVEGASVDNVLSWHPPPPNDDFAEATRLVGRRGRATGSNFVASRQAREPRHGRGARASVWYRWRAPRAGVLRLRTRGSAYDTLLAVYRGRRLGSLRQLGADDDSGPRFASALRIQVQRGRVYRIAVDGYKGEMGDIVLAWTLLPRQSA